MINSGSRMDGCVSKSNGWCRKAAYRAFILIVLAVFLAVTLFATTGCDMISPEEERKQEQGAKQEPSTTPEKKEEQKEPEIKPSIFEARRHLMEFMDARILRDEKRAEGFLSDGLKAKYNRSGDLSLIGESNPHYVGYFIIDSGTEGKNRFLFTVDIQEQYLGFAQGSLKSELITVAFTGKSYRIDEVESMPGASAFSEGKDLFFEEPKKTAKEKILNIDALPNSITPQGAEPDVSFGVGKEGFTVAAIGRARGSVAFGTWGTHGGLGYLYRQSGAWKPVVLDIVFEGSARSCLWSSDGRYLVFEVETPAGTNTIKVYDIKNGGTLVKTGLNRDFSADVYSLTYPRWVGESTLYFSVVRMEDGEGTPGMTGLWSYNVKTSELKKIS